MAELSEQEMLEKLQRFSTPTVSNVVATYPDNPLCLKLYNPWKGRWYTDQSVHCVYPRLGRRVGYAVTIVKSVPHPNSPSFSWQELVAVLWQAKKPIILVCQQMYPPEILNRAGLFGGQSTSLMKACGVVGVVTDGPSRDIDEMEPLGACPSNALGSATEV